MKEAVINSLDSVPLPGVPPGHGYRDRRRYGVAVHWVVDHSCLESFVRRHLATGVTRAGLTTVQDVQTEHCWGASLLNGQDRKP